MRGILRGNCPGWLLGEHGWEAPPLQQHWQPAEHEFLLQPPWQSPPGFGVSGMHHMGKNGNLHNDDGSSPSWEWACAASPALNLWNDWALGPARWRSLKATLSPGPRSPRSHWLLGYLADKSLWSFALVDLSPKAQCGHQNVFTEQGSGPYSKPLSGKC